MSEFDTLVSQNKDPNFPFFLSGDSEYPSIQIPAGELYEIYNPIFEEFGIYGNGPDWDGLITQALENKSPDLLNSINFNSEGDFCVIELDSIEDGEKIIKVLKETFNNETNLREFLKTVDTDLLDG